MKTKKIIAAVALSLTLGACAQNIKKADIPPSANPTDEITRLENDIQTGFSEQADVLASEGNALREHAYHLLDDVPADEQIDERLRVRAASLELVVRSAASLVAATGGSAMALDAAPQRLAREAIFHLVQAQTGPVREATLTLLAERSA